MTRFRRDLINPCESLGSIAQLREVFIKHLLNYPRWLDRQNPETFLMAEDVWIDPYAFLKRYLHNMTEGAYYFSYDHHQETFFFGLSTNSCDWLLVSNQSFCDIEAKYGHTITHSDDVCMSKRVPWLAELLKWLHQSSITALYGAPPQPLRNQDIVTVLEELSP
jgi:hypothetical protein